jgi:hypothetical protein
VHSTTPADAEPLQVGAIYYSLVTLREMPASRVQARGLVEPVVYMIVLGSVLM